MRGAGLRTSGAAWALPVLLATFGAAISAQADSAVPWTGLPESLGPAAVALESQAAGAFGNPALLASEPAGAARADAGLDARGTPWQRFGLHWPTVRND